jgi:hypothetical protein
MRTPSAMHVGATMRERLPDATQAEVIRAARALARSFGGQWAEPTAASDAWSAAVLAGFRLQTDHPF